MKGSIERHDLGQIGIGVPERLDSRKSLLLVQRRERGQDRQAIQDRLRGDDRLAEVRPAVHDTMSDRGHGPGQTRLNPPQ